MITIELMGGLGNQLFQIFTLISQSIDHNIEFHIQDNICVGNRKKLYFDNIFKNLKPYIKNINNPHIYNESTFEYKEIIINPNVNYKLEGYFQSYKYFNHNIHKILEILKLDAIRDNLKTKYKYENIVSLHFRLGDYLNLQEYHAILNIEYYINSLHRLIKDTNKNDWDILYFYEESDTEIVIENINKLKKIFTKLNFISIDHTLDDWEQLLCMTLCRHNIIANSSFSWMGAYLNHNNKIINFNKIQDEISKNYLLVLPNVRCSEELWHQRDITLEQAMNRAYRDTRVKALHWYKNDGGDGRINGVKGWYQGAGGEIGTVENNDWDTIPIDTIKKNCEVKHILFNSEIEPNNDVFDNNIYYPETWFGPHLSYKNKKDLCLNTWNII